MVKRRLENVKKDINMYQETIASMKLERNSLYS